MSKSISNILIVALCISIFSYVAAQKFAPPPVPDPEPVISNSYPNDLNRDRIDDRLSEKIEMIMKLEDKAATDKERQKALSELDRIIDVELIFSCQITQFQIDTFIEMGGEITHIYKAVSYGWNGRIPIGKIKELPSRLGPSLVLINEPQEAVLSR